MRFIYFLFGFDSAIRPNKTDTVKCTGRRFDLKCAVVAFIFNIHGYK